MTQKMIRTEIIANLGLSCSEARLCTDYSHGAVITANAIAVHAINPIQETENQICFGETHER
ncbi:MAG: hypothetical protein DRP56_01900 [Planctomycetota bacterium]|nr:MAG: hypothetical protein DRP56_01900 [Planctomycetota bacterium]